MRWRQEKKNNMQDTRDSQEDEHQHTMSSATFINHSTVHVLGNKTMDKVLITAQSNNSDYVRVVQVQRWVHCFVHWLHFFCWSLVCNVSVPFTRETMKPSVQIQQLFSLIYEVSCCSCCTLIVCCVGERDTMIQTPIYNIQEKSECTWTEYKKFHFFTVLYSLSSAFVFFIVEVQMPSCFFTFNLVCVLIIVNLFFN